MRAIRVALLEADVALPVVKEFIENIKPKAIGQEIIRSTSPGQMLVKIVYDELVSILGKKSEVINLNAVPPASLILVGFSGGFRRSELVAITRDDVEFVKEGVKIFVKKSKSDQSGEGMIKAIPSFKYNEYCPVENLRLWMFENRNDQIFPISDKNVALIIKKHAFKAGFDDKKYAGHSLRSGFATTTAESGANERNIMAMTGHKTTQMVRRYIQEANLFKNNALNKIKI
mgnify:CR=1 FL=1